MTAKETSTTFSRSRIPTFLGWLPFLSLGIGGGAFILNDRGVVELGLPVVAGLIVGVAALFSLFAGGTATVSPERLDYRSQSVRFDSVALVVRETSLADRLVGTSTFEFFIPGSDTISVTQIRQPDDFQRLLETNLPTPSEQLTGGQTERAEGSQRQEHGARMVDRRTFWEYWQADETLPEAAVVSKATLKSVMEVSDVDVDKLDDVDMEDAEGLSDIDKQDVTSGGTPTGG